MPPRASRRPLRRPRRVPGAIADTRLSSRLSHAPAGGGMGRGTELSLKNIPPRKFTRGATRRPATDRSLADSFDFQFSDPRRRAAPLETQE